jgi:hypothetical protein
VDNRKGRDGHHACQHPRHQRTTTEALRQVILAAPTGIGHREDGCQIGAGDHGHQAHHNSGAIPPGIHRVAGGVAQRHMTTCDATHDGAQEERGED